MPDAPHGIPLTIGVGGARSRIARNRSRIVAVMREAVDAYRAEIAEGGAEGDEGEAGKSHP
jgi:hypothetical protein